jgi:alpha-tubulin suppressor-like RCC1 family protein
MTMASPVRRWLAPAALLAVALLFACLKGNGPTDASASNVRFDLHAQVSGGSALHVTVVYLDQSSTSESPIPVTLLDQHITVAGGTQSLPLSIDLTRCLADPLHIPTGSSCELLAGVVLLQNGASIDSVSVGPITVTPGQTVHANTSLTPVGRVDVYPPLEEISVGQTLQLYDTVFSPTDTILTGTSVAWTSRNPAVATVDTGGLVTGVGQGVTYIVASVGGQSDSARVIVNPSSTGGGGGITFPGLPGDSVTFQAPAGGTLPAAGLVPVASTDTNVVGNLVATISYGSSTTGWLIANVSDSGFGSRVTHAPGTVIRMGQIRKQTGSGVTTPATLDVHPTTTSLAAGTYNATVTVTGSGGASGTVSIVYTVTTPTPALGFTSNPVSFDQYAYGSTAASAFSTYVENTGTGGTLGQPSQGVITYTGADAGWLTTGLSGDTITLEPNTTSLHVGTDTANIPYTVAGASNSPQNLTVYVNNWVTYTKVALGAAFGCGLTTASTVYCWGGDGEGELGDGGTDLSVQTPVRANIPYSPSNPVIDIEAGAYHACALLQNGAVYCWGRNDRGQLGIGTTTSPVSTPSLITSHTYQVITLGALFTCGIEGTPSNRAANYIDCWGDNTDGEFGNGGTTPTPTTSPVTVEGNSFYSISAGNLHMCGITGASGYLYCWGNDASGQIGNTYVGGNYPSEQFVNVANGNLTSVSAGGATTCAVDATGKGYCWGDNTDGEVGNGSTTTQYPSPVLIPGGISWTSISVGASSVCGIGSTADYCWGYNNYGQLMNNTTANSGTTSPNPVIGTGLFTQFVVGEASQSACYIVGGVVYCAGLNGNGQLGIGDAAIAYTGTPTSMFGQPAPDGVTPSRVPPRRTVTRAKKH